ncbi:MAG: glycosyltransferase family 4 protein [Pseudomonadota bacterium]
MVTTFYPPYHFGGDGTYVRALAKGLVQRGHEVTVIHCEDAYRLRGQEAELEQINDHGVTVHRIHKDQRVLSPLITQQLGIPGLKAGVLREILDDDFDVVNFHNISLIGGPGVLSLSKAPRNVYTLHEHWLLCPTHIFWKNQQRACDRPECIRCCVRSGIPPQWWRYTSLLQRNLMSVNLFLSPSEYTARRHREQLELQAPVEVLPLFSALDPVPEVQPSSTGELLFVFAGRMVASKGVRELLATFRRTPQYRLILLGDGELLLELRRRYADCDNIEFKGAVPQPELVAYYRRATAVILPSLAPETFGLTVVEAFACGTPALVRAAGGNRDTIDVSGAGYVYEDEPGLLQAMAQFSADPGLRPRLGQMARRAYEQHYTEEKHVSRYLDLVTSIPENTGGQLIWK